MKESSHARVWSKSMSCEAQARNGARNTDNVFRASTVACNEADRDFHQTRIHTLRFRAVNRDIFDAIRSGEKPVETRAATTKYINIKTGDTLRFVCGKNEFKKSIKRVKIFRTTATLLRSYKPEMIAPKAHSKKEIDAMYFSFPGYREKIKKFGIIAFQMK